MPDYDDSPRGKALQHSTNMNSLPNRRFTYTDRGITFVVSDISVDEPGALVATITASDSRGALPVDNPYRFVNPPVMTVTGVTEEWVDIGGTLVKQYIRTTSRDLINSAKAIVYDTVTTVAIKKGWTPA